MIETKIFSRLVLTCAAIFALGAATTMTSCTDGAGEDPKGPKQPTVPIITITTQPTAPAETLYEGSITGSLTVEATVTEGATLTYQWYENITASNEGGEAIDGETAVSFTLPTDLAVGTYYYFCVVSAEDAESVRTDVVKVTVGAVPTNARITWTDGKYALTTDPTDAGLFFKFGSVVGMYSGNGAVLTLPATDAQDSFDVGDIAWNPTGATDWGGVPMYDDYPAAVDAAYHTAANVKAGKGDPCRLVGLDLVKIKNAAAAQLTAGDIDNGLWRLPTNEENKSFSGYYTEWTETTAHWTTLNDVPGGMFPDADSGSAATFLPATGYRNVATGVLTVVGSYGFYWSGTPYSSANGYGLHFYAGNVGPSNNSNRGYGFAVRCVLQ